MAYDEHQQSAKDLIARCAIITLSDTRTPDTDSSGLRIAQLLLGDGHQVVDRRLLRDDAASLKTAIQELLRQDIDAILTTGGTGVSRRDATVAALEPLLDQKLPGFGEMFRMLSYAEIGSGAMLSRATAGVAQGKLVFAMPGSTPAVELAMRKLILPELRHLIYELRK